MDLRQRLERTILRRLRVKGADTGLIERQTRAFPLSFLCDMSEAVPEFIENRAVFACGPYRFAVVLWQEEYRPQPMPQRQDRYDAAPMVMSDLPAYPCPITGKLISSRSHHRDNLKRHGCEVAEPSTPRDTWREDKAEDHARKKAVHDAWGQLNYH